MKARQATTISSPEDITMRALRFNQFGNPAVQHVTDLPDPVGTAQEAVIRGGRSRCVEDR
jgi:hypothetical protein